jgi:hypothetical protein
MDALFLGVSDAIPRRVLRMDRPGKVGLFRALEKTDYLIR